MLLKMYAKDIIESLWNSPKNFTSFKILRDESDNFYIGLHNICTARWTNKGEAVTVILNYFQENERIINDSELIMTISDQRIKTCDQITYMEKFRFVFGCELEAVIFSL